MPRFLWMLILITACPFGTASPAEFGKRELQRLRAESTRLYEQGKYRDAIVAAKRAADAAVQVLGREDAYRAGLLEHLGEIYLFAGQYRDAQPAIEESLATRERLLGPTHVDTARSLRLLALLHTYDGNHPKAKALGQRALAVFETALGPQHPETVRSVLQLAHLYCNVADYAQAELLAQRALSIDEHALAPEQQWTADALSVLGTLYLRKEDYAKSEQLYQRALVIAEKVYGPAHPETARILGLLAELELWSGNYDSASSRLLRMRAIYHRTLNARNVDAARVQFGLSVVYTMQGAYAKAELTLKEGLRTHEAVGSTRHADYAFGVSWLVNIYGSIGAYEKAEAVGLRAVAIHEEVLGPDHPQTASSILRLSFVYPYLGAHQKALALADRAHRISEKVFGENNLSNALALQRCAQAYLAMGDRVRGEALSLRVLEIRKRLLQPESIDTFLWMEDVGVLHHLNGAYADARAMQLRALAGRERVLGPNNPFVARSLHRLAWVDWALGKPTPVLQLLRRAQRLRAQHTGRFFAAGSQDAKQVYLQRFAGEVFEDVTFSLAYPRAGGLELGLTSVLQHKGQALDSAAGSIARLRRSAQPKDQQLLVQLAEVASQLSLLAYQASSQTTAGAAQRIDALSQRQEALESELSIRTDVASTKPVPARLADVQRAIPGDAVLIEWFRYLPFNPRGTTVEDIYGPPRYVAYALGHEGRPAVVDLGTALQIEAQVQEFRRAVSNPLRDDVKQRAAALTDSIIAPLYPYLRGRRHLLLSPDGALNLVPMAALLDERGDYLQRRFEMTYLTSGRDLLQMADEVSAKGTAVVVAAPDYGPLSGPAALAKTVSRSIDLERAGMKFLPLPATAKEASILQQLFGTGGVRLLTQREASEERLKQVSRPSVLHIATHGFFLSDQELAERMELPTTTGRRLSRQLRESPLLRAGLALSGANLRRGGTEDGILTALEAAQLDLRGTQLVVLSACETGVGEVRNGEGVYGLRRALTLAGAQTQVTSLWKVGDDMTQTWMVSYYQRLFKRQGRSAALRGAQQAVMAMPGRAHPYFWAGFISIGNWTPMDLTAEH